jgi:hypothetical protein
MNAIVVDVRNGEFVAHGEYGNLAEELFLMRECEEDISHLHLLPEDEAYSVYA